MFCLLSSKYFIRIDDWCRCLFVVKVVVVVVAAVSVCVVVVVVVVVVPVCVGSRSVVCYCTVVAHCISFSTGVGVVAVSFCI